MLTDAHERSFRCPQITRGGFAFVFISISTPLFEKNHLLPDLFLFTHTPAPCPSPTRGCVEIMVPTGAGMGESPCIPQDPHPTSPGAAQGTSLHVFNFKAGKNGLQLEIAFFQAH